VLTLGKLLLRCRLLGGEGASASTGRRGVGIPWRQPAYSLFKYISLSILTVIFPGEPRLAGFIAAKNDGSGGDNWSYKACKAPITASPPTNQQCTYSSQVCKTL